MNSATERDWTDARFDRIDERIDAVERRLEKRIRAIEDRAFERTNKMIVAMAWLPAIAIGIYLIAKAATA